MTDAAAFKACFTDWRLIKGRKVVQVVLELPIEQADQAYQALGGMPNPAQSAWVAVARLKPERQVVPNRNNDSSSERDNAQPASEPEPPVRARKPVASEKRLAQQAGIMCSDKMFQRFLAVHEMLGKHRAEGYDVPEYMEEVSARAVRLICGVKSRSEIVPGTPAAAEWDRLLSKFTAWKLAA